MFQNELRSMGYQVQIFVNRKQETDNREQETDNREQGTGNREQETDNREQGTGNREQETGKSSSNLHIFVVFGNRVRYIFRLHEKCS
ncbi:hypothetical protein [Dapis sp. BLCC M172]|uniref:hypothetical protein n=1 Tax=Dapis sp. BLCC M172 TaxID=2975281 RepID=UPI003CF7EA9D